MDDKKIKKAVLILVFWAIVFWVGFRSGEVYNRMKTKIQVERILAPVVPKVRAYYLVERRRYNGYSTVSFDQIGDQDAVIKFFLNKELRPLLKLRDLKIYTSKGGRIY